MMDLLPYGMSMNWWILDQLKSECCMLKINCKMRGELCNS